MIYGAIIGNIICNTIAFIIGFAVLIKNLDMKFEFKKIILKPVIATIIMGSTSVFLYDKLKCIKLNNLAIIVTLLASSLIYMILIIILRIFTKEEIKSISRK